MGDLDRLAASIAELGLLQPTVITAAGRLIAGRRRLEAHRLLGRKTILCCVVEDLNGALPLLQAEIAENTCRRGFSPSEAVAAAEDLLPLAQEAAQQRIGCHFDRTSGNFSEVGNAMDQIANLMDRSGNCKITGLRDKVEIIANLKALIRQIEHELSETR
jgi:ParB-like chromosome segregation protein Spo0J